MLNPKITWASPKADVIWSFLSTEESFQALLASFLLYPCLTYCGSRIELPVFVVAKKKKKRLSTIKWQPWFCFTVTFQPLRLPHVVLDPYLS